jgi:hypothetical protein
MLQPQYLLVGVPRPIFSIWRKGESLSAGNHNPSDPPINLANQYSDWDTWALNDNGMFVTNACTLSSGVADQTHRRGCLWTS